MRDRDKLDAWQQVAAELAANVRNQSDIVPRLTPPKENATMTSEKDDELVDGARSTIIQLDPAEAAAWDGALASVMAGAAFWWEIEDTAEGTVAHAAEMADLYILERRKRVRR